MNRLHGLPARWTHAKEMVFERHIARVHLADPRIDAFSVRFDEVPSGGAGVDRGELSFGSPRQAQRSLRPIDFECARSGDLGETTCGRARRKLHLKKAIARDDEAEGASRVLDRGGKDVGNAAVVVDDTDVAT